MTMDGSFMETAKQRRELGKTYLRQGVSPELAMQFLMMGGVNKRTPEVATSILIWLRGAYCKMNNVNSVLEGEMLGDKEWFPSVRKFILWYEVGYMTLAEQKNSRLEYLEAIKPSQMGEGEKSKEKNMLTGV